jgi:hypothetical protein
VPFSTHGDECRLNDTAAQEHDLVDAGAEKMFTEQASSVAYRDRLKECLAIEADLSKRKIGLAVLSIGGEQLDTRNPTSKLMLTILAEVATWEREIMLERQREGIAKAKSEGKQEAVRLTSMLRRLSACARRWGRRLSPSSSGLRGVASIGCWSRSVRRMGELMAMDTEA